VRFSLFAIAKKQSTNRRFNLCVWCCNAHNKKHSTFLLYRYRLHSSGRRDFGRRRAYDAGKSLY